MSEYKVKVNGREYVVKILGERGSSIEVEVEGTRLSVTLEEVSAKGGVPAYAPVAKEAPMAQPAARAEAPAEAAPKPTQAAPAAAPAPATTAPQLAPAVSGHVVTSKVPGKVKEVKVTEGQQVQAGQPVVIIESMKMDIEMRTNKSGIVKAVYVKPGQFVQKDAPLILVE